MIAATRTGWLRTVNGSVQNARIWMASALIMQIAVPTRPAGDRPRCMTNRGWRLRLQSMDGDGIATAGYLESLRVCLPRSGGMTGPGEQGRDDEGALAYVVRNLELQVHRADVGRGEHVCAVMAVA